MPTLRPPATTYLVTHSNKNGLNSAANNNLVTLGSHSSLALANAAVTANSTGGKTYSVTVITDK
jgi:hypothetical protein